jgi:act minimal PKS chain-length factor (CLF/KS beta)
VTGAAVVTGIGVVAPGAPGADAYWARILAGTNAIARISRFDPARYPVRLAGEVRDFVAADWVPSTVLVQTDRWTQLGLAATQMALADAGLDPATLPEYDMAVVTASSSGGTEFGQREIQKLWQGGPQFVGVYQSIAWFYAATTGQISIRHGMRGPCSVICAEQAGGLDVLGEGRRLLRGDVRAVVVGGTDASLCPYGLTAALATGRLSCSEDATRAYAPFDARASGYVPAEGGAMLIMEDAGSASARGAYGYGQIAGYAATFDPAPETGRQPAFRRAVELALDDAGVDASTVDVVFADAAGVPELDRQEAAALCAVFGPWGVPVTAPKTMTGRLNAGGAALDVATALLAMRNGVIPPTIGVSRLAAGCELDLVRDRPRAASIRTVLVVARGYGGFNAATVLTAWESAPTTQPTATTFSS